MEAQNNFVIVEPINRNDDYKDKLEKQSGLLVHIKYQGAPNTGYVRSIGKQIKEPGYKIGDKILFKNDLPDGFHFEGTGYLPIKHEDILAVIA